MSAQDTMPDTIHLLHLDDEPGALATTENYFERFDEEIEIETTTDPRGALDRLTPEPDTVDCLLCDYEMPEIDGLSVHDRLREADVEIPFVLYTGKGGAKIEAEARAAGVTAYVEKGEGMDHLESLADRIKAVVRGD